MKNAQIRDAQALCIECQEGITNPICPECLGKEIRTWNESAKEFLWNIKKDSLTDGVRCMFCGKGIDICAHCYSKAVYEALVEKYPELGEEFIDLFNYGLREELM